MKLREALVASNCGKVKDVCGSVYYKEEADDVLFYQAEKDIWEPVIKKEKKTHRVWVNVYSYGISSVTYPTKEEAIKASIGDRLDTIELTGEYEE